MTIAASEVNRKEYNGNGVTLAFATPYFQVNADLVVVLVASNGTETTQTLNTHYALTGAGVAGGGTCTMVTAPATGQQLVIYTDPVLSQEVDLVENDELPVEAAVEDPLDKLTLIARRLKELIQRTLRLPEGDTGFVAADTYLPNKATRASKYLAFDANGKPMAADPTGALSAVSPFMATVLDDTTAVAAATTLKLSDTSDVTLGDTLIGYKNTGTGAVARTVHAKLEELPSISDWTNQAGVEASGKDWIFLPSAQSLTVAGALAKNYWGPGSLALASGDMPGTQGDAAYGFVVLETAAAGSGQHFTFGAKVFTGTRTDTSSAPGQNHCVAGYFEAQRGAGSSDGIWAVNSVTEVYNLSGATIGYEIDVNNSSGSDPGVSPANPYIGLSIVSGAAGRGGTAIIVDRNGDFASNHWHRGLWIKEVLSRAFELTNCGSAATGLWTDNTFKMRGTAAGVESVLALIPFDDTEATSFLFYLTNAADNAVKGGWLKRGEIAINESAGKGTAGLSIKGIANGDNIIFLQRNTDTTPTGTFMRFVNAANSAVLFDVDHASAAGDTNVMLSVAGAAAVRVTVGANDSGGAGFKLLRVPN